MLNKDEKEFLAELVKRERDRLKKGQESSAQDSSSALLKAEHQTMHFLEGLLEKLR